MIKIYKVTSSERVPGNFKNQDDYLRNVKYKTEEVEMVRLDDIKGLLDEAEITEYEELDLVDPNEELDPDSIFAGNAYALKIIREDLGL